MGSAELADWIANGLSVLALCIALSAFVHEKRRGRREADSRRRDYIAACQAMITTAETLISDAANDLQMYPDQDRTRSTSASAQLWKRLNPVADSLSSLRTSAPTEAGIVLPLSRAIAIIERFARYPHDWLGVKPGDAAGVFRRGAEDLANARIGLGVTS